MSTIIDKDVHITKGTRVTYDSSTVDDSAYAYEDPYQPGAHFRNSGTVDVELDGGGRSAGFIVPTGGAQNAQFWNDATGVFKVTENAPYSSFDQTFGFLAPEFGIRFLNDGLFEVSGTVFACGVGDWDPMSAMVTNNGTISVTAAFDATGVWMENGGTFSNTGSIDVHGDESAVGFFADRVDRSFSNTGEIVASVAPDSPYASVGFQVFDGDLVTATYTNAGLIQGDYAIRVIDGDGLASLVQSDETIVNSGTLRGVVELSFGDDVLSNTGTVDGFVDLGQGNDVYQGVSGVSTHEVSGGDGFDILFGGAQADILFGDTGTDVISAGGGDDTVDGGRDSDALDGGAGVDTLSYLDATSPVVVDLAAGTARGAGVDRIHSFERVEGGGFADQISGSNVAETLDGAAGSDTLNGGGGDDVLMSGPGADRLTGGAGKDTFVFSAGDGADLITDFQGGAHGDEIDIHGYAGPVSLKQAGADVLLTLGGGDSIRLQNEQLSSLTSGNIHYDAAPLTDEPRAIGPGTLAVESNLVIGGNEVFAIVDPDPLYLVGQDFVQTGLIVTPLVAPALPGEFAQTSPDVFNSGKFSLDVTSNDGEIIGIDRSPPEYANLTDCQIVNSKGGTISIDGHGSAEALGSNAAISTWNAGTIEVSSSNGSAEGWIVSVSNNVFVNSGVFTVDAALNAEGVEMDHSGEVWNSGRIAVSGGAACTGIDESGVGYDQGLVNSGQIVVTDQTSAIDSVAYQYLNNEGAYVIHNSGLIAGDYAIMADQTMSPYGSTTQIYNSGQLQGRVAGNNDIEALYNSGQVSGHIDLGGGADIYDGRTGHQTGGIDGGSGDDLLLGGSDAETISGDAGNDTISGGAGKDTLTGGQGGDVFHFETGWGADVVTDFGVGGLDIIETDYVRYKKIEQVGADTLIVFSTADTVLLKNVQASSLSAKYFRYGAADLAPAPLEPASPATPDAPETPAATAAPTLARWGTDGTDHFNGSAGSDVISGLGGDDLLSGGKGDDWLDGGDGADTLNSGVSGADGDTLSGGAGADTFVFANNGGTAYIKDFNAAEGDRIQVSTANYSLEADIRWDYVVLPSGSKIAVVNQDGQGLAGAIEVVPAGKGARDGAAHLRTVHAPVNGGVVDTGTDRVHLIGGGQRDVFVVDPAAHALDRISHLSDQGVIDLHLIDADVSRAGDQAFHLTTAFDHELGEARLIYQPSHDRTLLLLDTDGDGRSDLTLILKGDHHDFTGFAL